MEFKTGDIVKILSPEGIIIYKVLPYGCIELLSHLAHELAYSIPETGRTTLDWQKITIWR